MRLADDHFVGIPHRELKGRTPSGRRTPLYFSMENSISFQGIDVTGRIGIRVNPVVGGGKVAILSTAGKTSKFGLLMVDECEAKLLELYGKYKFLQGES